MPGRHLIGLLSPPVCRLPRFLCWAWMAFAAFLRACAADNFLRGFLVANCFRGALPGPPVFLRAVFFCLAISLKYKESLGNMPPFGLAASSKDRSFPLDLTGSFTVEGSSTFLRLGEDSGVLSTLVLGVELNSEQMIEPESLQPVLSSTGAVKVSKIAEQ